MPRKLSLRIDGELINVPEGRTILEAARAHGKYIPTLCWLEGTTPVGACRLCMVQVSGVNRLLPACTTPAQDGMSVATTSPEITRYRRTTIELLLIERNHFCAVCVSNTHCELQDMAASHGVTTVGFPYNYPRVDVDVTHPLYVLDHNRCILCTRCVRVCAEIEGAQVWDVSGRGIASRIVSGLNQPWGEAQDCTNCGKCVQSCPTGALAKKGCAVAEMIKRNDHVSALAARQGAGL